jgi:enolase
MLITKTDAYQIFDSRGNPTVEAEITLDTGIRATASVPSGASKGKFEAVELRDGDPDSFSGLSVSRAVNNIRGEIGTRLKGRAVDDQEAIDELLIALDGTPNKARLGANAILAVSMAVARAAAISKNMPLYQSLGEGTLLPLPEIQIIGGGAHSGGRIDIQDFMIICNGARNYRECLEMTFNVYKNCGTILKERKRLFGLADAGGYWPQLDTNEQGFDLILEAIEQAGYIPGQDISLSVDIAASELFSDGRYQLSLEDQWFSPSEFYNRIRKWCLDYPIVSLEDPFSEDDHDNWARLTTELGSGLNIIGDDLFTTSVKRVRHGIAHGLANSVLIKLNQIGTVTETLRCIATTQAAGWLPVISGRSGETEDPFISHLAVATNAGQLKLGALARSERTVKWNEVLRIERQLGEYAGFAGASQFSSSDRRTK